MVPEIKPLPPLIVNNVEVPADIQIIIEDIINAYKEQRIIGIYRNAETKGPQPAGNEEQKIVIRILKKELK